MSGKDVASKNNVLAAQEVLLQLGKTCTVCELAVASADSSVSQKSSLFIVKWSLLFDSQRYNTLADNFTVCEQTWAIKTSGLLVNNVDLATFPSFMYTSAKHAELHSQGSRS